jgi:hypothetical protein
MMGRVPGLLAVLLAAGCGGSDGGRDTTPDVLADHAAGDTTETTEADAEPDGEEAGEAADTSADVPIDAPPPDVNGRLETGGELPVLYLWGTRAEIGYAEGALLCGRITRFFTDYILDHAIPNSGYDYATVTSLVRLMHRFPEGDLAELEAMIAGMRDHCPAETRMLVSENLEPAAGGRREITVEDLKVGHALPDFLCSSLTVWGGASATGNTLHARNLDFLFDPDGTFLAEHLVKVYDSTDEDVRFLSVAIPGLAGCISCFGEQGAGVTIHNASGPESLDDRVPRILTARAAFVAALAAAGDPVAAAEAAVEASPQQMGDNFHFSFPCPAPGCTGGVVFELDGDASHADGQVTVRRPGEDAGGVLGDEAIVCTNHYLKRQPLVPGTGSTYVRFATVRDGVNAAAAAGGLGVAGALELMRASQQQTASLLTVHTVIMDVASLTLRVYVAESIASASPNDPVPAVFELPELFAGLP